MDDGETSSIQSQAFLPTTTEEGKEKETETETGMQFTELVPPSIDSQALLRTAEKGKEKETETKTGTEFSKLLHLYNKIEDEDFFRTAETETETGRTMRICAGVFPYIDRIHVGREPITPDGWSKYITIEIEEDLDRSKKGQSRLSSKKSNSKSEGKIRHVPEDLHDVCPKAYKPRYSTIGPFNHNFKFSTSSVDMLSPMDHCKVRCVKHFLGQCSQAGHPLKKLTDAIPFLDKKEAGRVYFGIPDYDSETLQLLILVDAVFILEFMCFLAAKYVQNSFVLLERGCVQFHPLIVGDILRDLFIAGNQVPLWHVNHLANLSSLSSNDLVEVLVYMISQCTPFNHLQRNPSNHLQRKPSINILQLIFNHLLRNLFYDLGYCKTTPPLNREELVEGLRKTLFDRANDMHLLDLLYRSCVRSSGMWESSESQLQELPQPLKLARIPQASELCKVWVQFKGVDGNTSQIYYDPKNRIMHLPKIAVYEETESMLRNLVAHEVTSKEMAGEFCAYVKIMDSLIDTLEDIVILRNAQVLENHLGSDEKLLRMWNDMGVNLTEPTSIRLQIMTDDIIHHYNNNWRRLYVEFHHRFLSRPWYIISTIAAFLLLAMTALQTAYTVLGFYKA